MLIHTLRTFHLRFCLIAILLPLACGGSRKERSSGGTGDDTEPVVVRVERDAPQQILEGFGASVAWYGEWFTQHPNRQALGEILFRDLGLDILRLRNQHRTVGDTPDPAGLDVFHSAEASLGHPPRVLLTSWAPPPELKASGKTRCDSSDTHNTCSLRLDADGTFPYVEFGDYWVQSLEAYRAEGLEPYYISIQNEPDYKPNGWEGCRFNETERDGLPGYDRALDAVSKRLAQAGITSRIIGAETAQLQNGAALRYASALDADQLYGVAHHLYDGSTWKSPRSYWSAMNTLTSNFPNHPKFQTEFSPTEDGVGVEGGFEVAWLIHNSIEFEKASAYLHWELFWPDSGLVAVSNPWDPTKWETPEGYRILEPYHSLRHYARFTDPGDVVLPCQPASSQDILCSAFLSADDSRLTVVVLNVSDDGQAFTLDLSGFDFVASLAYVTTEGAPFQSTTPLSFSGVNDLQLEARAIATYVVSKNTTLEE